MPQATEVTLEKTISFTSYLLSFTETCSIKVVEYCSPIPPPPTYTHTFPKNYNWLADSYLFCNLLRYIIWRYKDEIHRALPPPFSNNEAYLKEKALPCPATPCTTPLF